MIMRRPVLLGLLVLVGCGTQESTRGAHAAPAHARSAPQRVASLTVLGDEVLWGLGEPVRGRVVAVSSMVDDPRYSPVANAWPEAVPRVSATAESVLAVGPDLAIIASFTSVETRRMLERADVEIVLLDAFDGFDDYRATVRTIGAAVNADVDAERMVGAFDARLHQLQAQRTDPRPAVISWNDGNVAGRRTTFDDAAEAAGFANLAAEHGVDGHARIGLETLVVWDPAWLVIACGEVDCAQAERMFAARPGVGSMRAVGSGRVVGVESPILYSTGASMLDLVEVLQRRKELAR